MGETIRNIYLLQFDKMCRLCLSQNIDIIYIFNQNSLTDGSPLKHRIKECVTLEVSDMSLPYLLLLSFFLIKRSNLFRFQKTMGCLRIYAGNAIKKLMNGMILKISASNLI